MSKKNNTNTEPHKNPKSAFAKKKSTQKRISLLITIFLWCISLSLFLFCLSNLYQQYFNQDEFTGFFGIGNAIVVSDSMHPTLKVNDFIVYQKVNTADLSPEDIIVYQKDYGTGPILIVHRLKSITDGYVVTQGDNNAVEDEPFKTSDIVGKMVLRVPKMGYVINALSTIYAIIILALFLGIGILLRIVIYIIHQKSTIAKIASDKENKQALQSFFNM